MLHAGQWETVCDDTFYFNDARVACKFIISGFEFGYLTSDLMWDHVIDIVIDLRRNCLCHICDTSRCTPDNKKQWNVHHYSSATLAFRTFCDCISSENPCVSHSILVTMSTFNILRMFKGTDC